MQIAVDAAKNQEAEKKTVRDLMSVWSEKIIVGNSRGGSHGENAEEKCDCDEGRERAGDNIQEAIEQ